MLLHKQSVGKAQCRQKLTVGRHVAYILACQKFRWDFSTLKTRGSTYMRVVIWSTTFPGLPMKVYGWYVKQPDGGLH